jgi:hypothetical protein
MLRGALVHRINHRMQQESGLYCQTNPLWREREIQKVRERLEQHQTTLLLMGLERHRTYLRLPVSGKLQSHLLTVREYSQTILRLQVQVQVQHQIPLFALVVRRDQLMQVLHQKLLVLAPVQNQTNLLLLAPGQELRTHLCLG